MLALMISAIRFAVISGVVGTLFMDVGAIVLRRAGLTRGVEPAQLARWFGWLLHGRFAHEDIRAAPDINFPLPAAVLVHYGIGIALASLFWFVLRAVGEERSWTPVLGVPYGVATSLFAWFVMFPAMGFGLFGNAAPELLLFRSSLVNHLLYGVGLALAARFLRAG